MDAFLNSCLDEHMSYERIQWVSTIWPPGSEVQEDEVVTPEEEEAAIENEISTDEKEAEWIEINLQDDENEAATTEAECQSTEIEAQPPIKKRSFRKSLKKLLCCWCYCCGKKGLNTTQ